MASITAYINSGSVFASNTNKIYLSSDGTLNTTISNITTSINSIEKHPSNGFNYLGVTDDGIYRHDQSSASAQRASHWIINVPTSASITSYIGAQGFNNSNIWYGYHNLSGYILRSLDFGKTFNIVNTGLPQNLTGSTTATSFAFTQNYVFMGLANNGGCYRLDLSTDVWSSLSELTGLTINEISVNPNTDTIFFMTNTALYRSTNYGSSVSSVTGSLTHGYSVLVNPNDNAIYASISSGGVARIIKSTNNGDSWADSVTSDVYKHLRINVLNNKLYCYNETDTTIGYSINDGSSWSFSASPTAFFDFKVGQQSTPVLYGVNAVTGLYQTNDNLASWTNSLTSGGGNLTEFRSIGISKLNDIFIGGSITASSKSSPYVQKLLNDESSWIKEMIRFRSINNIKFDSSNNMIYCIDGSGIFKKASGSIDSYGYIQINTGLTSKRTKQLQKNGSYSFVITNDGFYRSDPSTYTSWTASNSGLTTTDCLSIIVDESTTSTLYIGTNGGGIFKSTNSGGTWTYKGLNGHKITSMLYTLNGYIYAASYGYGLYVSMDSGSTWNLLSGLSEQSIKNLGKKNSAEFYVSAFNSLTYNSASAGINITEFNIGINNTKHVLSLDIRVPKEYWNTSSKQFDVDGTKLKDTPFISKIGLLNEKNELMAVGKLSKPIRKDSDRDIYLSFDLEID